MRPAPLTHRRHDASLPASSDESLDLLMRIATAVESLVTEQRLTRLAVERWTPPGRLRAHEIECLDALFRACLVKFQDTRFASSEIAGDRDLLEHAGDRFTAMTPRAASIAIGKLFERAQGEVIGNLVLRKAASIKHVSLWRLEKFGKFVTSVDIIPAL